MTLIGCTGHQTLSATTYSAVEVAIGAFFERLNPQALEGICSLAVGADQIFARKVLSHNGRLRVVIPCAHYEATFAGGESREGYEELLANAAVTETLPYSHPSEEAFMAAGRFVVDRSELLLAVWDGAPAVGLGGTADVVRYARDSGKSVKIIWPAGSRRS